jgi:hypothetical protein
LPKCGECGAFSLAKPSPNDPSCANCGCPHPWSTDEETRQSIAASRCSRPPSRQRSALPYSTAPSVRHGSVTELVGDTARNAALCPFRRGNALIHEDPDAIDYRANDLAGLQEATGIPARGDAARRTGSDDVTWLMREHLTDVLHGVYRVEPKVRSSRILHDLSVDLATQSQVSPLSDLIRRHQYHAWCCPALKTPEPWDFRSLERVLMSTTRPRRKFTPELKAEAVASDRYPPGLMAHIGT